MEPRRRESSPESTLTLSLQYFLEQFYLTYPLNESYSLPSTRFHTTRRIFLIAFYLKSYFPAHVLDVLCRVVNKKPT